jgi:ParB/RepB/Spo0J family partition protein
VSDSASAAAMTLDPLTSNTGGDFVTIAIDQIVPHPENPRRIDDDHPSLVGLAESIRNTGLINPLTVRQSGGMVQILAGERRWRAARLAGLATIEAKVVDANDQQAFAMTVVENLQRDDLHWLEEARGVEAMTARGWDIATIAGQVGKSEQWVRLRAKLASISPKWRKAVEDPRSDFHGWPVAMLELIARFPIEQQDVFLGEGGRRCWEIRNCNTAAELEKALDEHFLRVLKAAPWDLADVTLNRKAGACTLCPKRSSCQQQLFADTKDDRCLDATCWATKAKAHAATAIDRTRVKHPKAIILVTEGAEPDDVPEKHRDKARHAYEFQPAKADDAKAVPAIVGAGDRAGEIVYVKPREYGSSSSPAERKALAPKDQLAQRLAARRKAVVIALIEKLGGDAGGGYGTKPKASKCTVRCPTMGRLLVLASNIGVSPEVFDHDVTAKNLVEQLKAKSVDVDAACERLWVGVRESIVEGLREDTYGESDLGFGRAVAAACDVDLAALEREVQTDLPLSKALAALYEEDGTPRKEAASKPSLAKAAAKPKAPGKAKPAAKPKAVAKPKAKAKRKA